MTKTAHQALRQDLAPGRLAGAIQASEQEAPVVGGGHKSAANSQAIAEANGSSRSQLAFFPARAAPGDADQRPASVVSIASPICPPPPRVARPRQLVEDALAAREAGQPEDVRSARRGELRRSRETALASRRGAASAQDHQLDSAPQPTKLVAQANVVCSPVGRPIMLHRTEQSIRAHLEVYLLRESVEMGVQLRAIREDRREQRLQQVVTAVHQGGHSADLALKVLEDLSLACDRATCWNLTASMSMDIDGFILSMRAAEKQQLLKAVMGWVSAANLRPSFACGDVIHLPVGYGFSHGRVSDVVLQTGVYKVERFSPRGSSYYCRPADVYFEDASAALIDTVQPIGAWLPSSRLPNAG